MKLINVSIVGTTPLLQHRFGEAAQQSGNTRKVLTTNGTPREEAEKVAYRDPAGKFYFPGAAISRLLREAGGNHKLRGSRKSAKYIVPAACLIMADAIHLVNGDGKSPIKDYEVDSRPVTIPATKGRIMRHRPRFDQWGAKFTIRINEALCLWISFKRFSPKEVSKSASVISVQRRAGRSEHLTWWNGRKRNRFARQGMAGQCTSERC